MAIKGPDIISQAILNNKQFIAAIAQNVRAVRGFTTTVSREGKKVEGTWWRRFGAVAIGFTAAYRAMNAFERGLGKVIGTMTEAIKQSGELASQQAKLAFWTQNFAKEQIGFNKAFAASASVISELRKESVRSISSIEELNTGLDELAQAGVPITKKLVPAIVSLTDFTAMVAQTVGSTTRQIRQEFQALMDGTVRFTNQLVRVLKNMGVLTAQDLQDLKNMTNRAQILDKVLEAIHTRWMEMVDTLLRTDVSKAIAAWERSWIRMYINVVEVASKIEGVPSLFAEVFYQARKNMEFTEEQTRRMARAFIIASDALKFLVVAFERVSHGMASVVTIGWNLYNIFSQSKTVRVAAYATAISLVTGALDKLARVALWFAIRPAIALSKAFLFVISPLLLMPALIAAAIYAIRAYNVVLNTELSGSLKKVGEYANTLGEALKELPGAIGSGLRGMARKLLPQSELDILRNRRDALQDALIGITEDIKTFEEKIAKGKDLEFWGKKLRWAETELKATWRRYFLVLEEIEKAEARLGDKSELSEALQRLKDEFNEFGKVFWDLVKNDVGAAVEYLKGLFKGMLDPGLKLPELGEAAESASIGFGKVNKELSDMEKRKYDRMLKKIREEVARMSKSAEDFEIYQMTEQIKEFVEVLGNIPEIDLYRQLKLKEIAREFSNLAKAFDQAVDSMEADLSDFLFDFAKGTAEIEDLWKAMLDSMLRSFTDFLAAEIKAQIIGQLTPTGYTGGLMGFLSGRGGGTALASVPMTVGGGYGVGGYGVGGVPGVGGGYGAPAAVGAAGVGVAGALGMYGPGYTPGYGGVYNPSAVEVATGAAYAPEALYGYAPAPANASWWNKFIGGQYGTLAGMKGGALSAYGGTALAGVGGYLYGAQIGKTGTGLGGKYSTASKWLGAGGAIIGMAIGGPIGAAIGGFLGAQLGSFAGAEYPPFQYTMEDINAWINPARGAGGSYVPVQEKDVPPPWNETGTWYHPIIQAYVNAQRQIATEFNELAEQSIGELTSGLPGRWGSKWVEKSKDILRNADWHFTFDGGRHDSADLSSDLANFNNAYRAFLARKLESLMLEATALIASIPPESIPELPYGYGSMQYRLSTPLQFHKAQTGFRVPDVLPGGIMPAMLHPGERVLTSGETDSYERGVGHGLNFYNYGVVTGGDVLNWMSEQVKRMNLGRVGEGIEISNPATKGIST